MKNHGADGLTKKEIFLDALQAEAARYPYKAFANAHDITFDNDYLLPHVTSRIRYLPLKSDWIPAEFLAFEGVEFCEAAARCLRRREATPGEIYSLGVKNRSWTKYELLLQMDCENRKEGTGVSLHGVRACRFFWKLQCWLEKGRIRLPAKVARACFRLLAKRDHFRSMSYVSQRHLLFALLARLDDGNRGKRAK